MTPRDIHIASGPGGGSGTSNDPYLADTATRFDEILRGVGEGAHIHLGPGVFLTRGFRHTIGTKDFRWDVRSGWTIDIQRSRPR